MYVRNVGCLPSHAPLDGYFKAVIVLDFKMTLIFIIGTSVIVADSSNDFTKTVTFPKHKSVICGSV